MRIVCDCTARLAAVAAVLLLSCGHAKPPTACQQQVSDCMRNCELDNTNSAERDFRQDTAGDNRTACERTCQDSCD